MIARLRRVAGVSLSACLLSLVVAGPFQSASAQQEPVAVMAVAGIDRVLDDVDFLFAAGEAPQHAEMIRGVVANLNGLRGLDRSRPVGVYLYFPTGGQKDPQPLLFFPVSDVDELLTSVHIGNALRLERTDRDNRLTFYTDDGEFPVELQHGYAFLDPSKTGARLNHPLSDPADLLGDVLGDYDAVAVLRREGVPPFLFEVVVGQLETESLKQQKQKEGESDADYVIRRGIEQGIFSLMKSAVRDWQGASLGLVLSEESRTARLDVRLAMDPDGETTAFLQCIPGEGSQFAAQLAEASAFSLVMNWQPTDHGRDLLESIVETIRVQVDQEVADGDVELREAVAGVMDALEATAADGQFDSYLQWVGSPPNSFVLVGATAIAEATKVAAGIERLLPYAAESDDVREIEMNVGRAGDVAIHRMWPRELRKQDRRLYGDDAAIYLAAGRGAMWLAVGGEGTLELLSETISQEPPDAGNVSARPGSLDAGGTPLPAGPSLLDMSLHASDWIGLARTDGGGKKAKFAQLARQAFENPEDDGLQMRLVPTDAGLQLSVRIEHGTIRLIGLALAERMNRP